MTLYDERKKEFKEIDQKVKALNKRRNLLRQYLNLYEWRANKKDN